MSDSVINTKSNKAGREIEIETPAILTMTSVADLVVAMGEEAVVRAVNAQNTVSFRSHIRTKLEANTDGDITNSDDDIRAMDFTDWKPEARTRKSAEEKAAELMGRLTPEQIAAVLAKLEG